MQGRAQAGCSWDAGGVQVGCRFKRMCSTIATSAASAAVGSRNCSTPLPRATPPRVPVAVPPPPWCWGRSGGQPLSAVDGTCSDPWWRGGGGAAKAGCRGAGGVVVGWWKRWGGSGEGVGDSRPRVRATVSQGHAGRGRGFTAVPRSDFISVLYRSVSLSVAATRAKPPRSSTACAPAAAAALSMAGRTTKSAQSAYLRRSRHVRAPRVQRAQKVQSRVQRVHRGRRGYRECSGCAEGAQRVRRGQRVRTVQRVRRVQRGCGGQGGSRRSAGKRVRRTVPPLARHRRRAQGPWRQRRAVRCSCRPLP